MGTAISVLLANNYSVGSYSTIFMIIEKYIKVEAQVVFITLDLLLAIASTLLLGIEIGLLLLINAIVAYFTVKFALPRLKRFFKSFNS
jgi:uncharacterized membrane protein YczE